MYTFLQTMVVMALAFLSLSAGTEAFTSISAMKMPQMRAAERTTSLFLRGGTTGLSMAASTDKSVPQIIVKAPTDKEKEIASGWPTWGCGVSKFPWSYDSSETCLILEGEVTVTPDSGEPVKIKAGDMATFPKGMSCTWDVTKAINKHYNFD